ncbi:MAG: Gfo/Idh/MocA family protein [Negativicutes bacterium]
MLKTAIIGAGAIAHSHVDALNKLGKVEIIGVLDINHENAQGMATKCNSKVIERIEDVLDKVDMVHVLTPPSTHKDYVVKAAQAKVHVLVEKPIAINESDALEMIQAAKENDVCLLVGFSHRYRMGYKHLADLVHTGTLGNIINCFSYRLGVGTGFPGYKTGHNWRKDANLVCGMTIESLSHDIDMLRGLAGEIASVRATTLGTMQELPQFDNNASVALSFSNGAIGVLHASWMSHLGLRTIGIIGSKGSAFLEGDNLWEFQNLRVKTADMEYETVHKINDHYDNIAYIEENRHFVDCVLKGKEPFTNGHDGLAALKITHAVLKSQGENIVVNL